MNIKIEYETRIIGGDWGDWKREVEETGKGRLRRLEKGG